MYIGSFNGLRPIREDINPNCVPLFQKEQVRVWKVDLKDKPLQKRGLAWLLTTFPTIGSSLMAPAGGPAHRSLRHPIPIV